MPKLSITRYWCQKSQEILKSSQVSVAKKILAYKIFLRPMLIFDWYAEHPSKIKVLEIKALRQIFGACSENSLYQKFKDIDVVSYMKLQGIRWQRKTGSRLNSLRQLLHNTSESTDDPAKYFSKAKIRGFRNKKIRGTKCRHVCSDPCAGPSHIVRRSSRLASKDNFDTLSV